MAAPPNAAMHLQFQKDPRFDGTNIHKDGVFNDAEEFLINLEPIGEIINNDTQFIARISSCLQGPASFWWNTLGKDCAGAPEFDLVRIKNEYQYFKKCFLSIYKRGNSDALVLHEFTDRKQEPGEIFRHFNNRVTHDIHKLSSQTIDKALEARGRLQDNPGDTLARMATLQGLTGDETVALNQLTASWNYNGDPDAENAPAIGTARVNQEAIFNLIFKYVKAEWIPHITDAMSYSQQTYAFAKGVRREEARQFVRENRQNYTVFHELMSATQDHLDTLQGPMGTERDRTKYLHQQGLLAAVRGRKDDAAHSGPLPLEDFSDEYGDGDEYEDEGETAAAAAAKGRKPGRKGKGKQQPNKATNQWCMLCQINSHSSNACGRLRQLIQQGFFAKQQKGRKQGPPRAGKGKSSGIVNDGDPSAMDFAALLASMDMGN